MAAIEAISDLEVALASSVWKKTLTNRHTWKGTIEVGGAQIGVLSYLRTQEAKLPTPKKISGRSHESHPDGNLMDWMMEIQPQILNPLNPDELLNAEDLVKAYRYGKTLVNVDFFVESKCKYKTPEKCLKVIAFAQLHRLPRHYFMGATEYFLPDKNDPTAQSAFHSLVDALAVKEHVAICRYAKRAGASVHLYALFSNMSSEVDQYTLTGVKIPFLNDLRDYDFPDLALGNPEGVFAKLPRLKPSEEQMDAARALVNALDLTKGGATDNDEPLELLIPDSTPNPVLGYFYTCLQYRAANPRDRTLPEFKQSLFGELDQMFRKANDDIELFHKTFPLDKTAEQKKLQRVWWGDQALDEPVQLQNYGGDPTKKRKIGEIADLPLGADLDMDKLLNPGASTVSTVTPVADFEEMIKRVDVDLVDKAITEMKSVIFKLINDSIGTQFYGKAISCLNALRRGCIANEETEFFNNCMTEIQNTYAFKKRHDFWEEIIKERLTLISSDEAEDSFVTIQEAKDFLKIQADLGAPPPAFVPQLDADADDPINFID